VCLPDWNWAGDGSASIEGFNLEFENEALDVDRCDANDEADEVDELGLGMLEVEVEELKEAAV
jgi:hypothetical protein